MNSESMATDKLRVTALIDPELKPELESLAKVENRSISNLIESLIIRAISEARESGVLPDSASASKN